MLYDYKFGINACVQLFKTDYIKELRGHSKLTLTEIGICRCF